jgi:NAD(P)H-flavin reductase
MISATVTAAQKLTPTLHLLRLKPEGGLNFKAGQFVIIHLPQDPDAAPGSKMPKGFYSLASPEHQSEEIELLIEDRGGYVSTWVCGRKAGDVLDLEGPLGKFSAFEADQASQIFLGYKAGIAPLRSIILSMLHSAPHRHIHLFLGAKGSAELIFDSDWRALAAQKDKFHYHPVVSPTAENPFFGKNQDPADELIKKMTHKSGHAIYLAGFNAEVDPMLAKLLAAGFDKDHIKTEKFG